MRNTGSVVEFVEQQYQDKLLHNRLVLVGYGFLLYTKFEEHLYNVGKSRVDEYVKTYSNTYTLHIDKAVYKNQFLA
tara:strand:+ start:14074 stop:14301 length:228 start_codon:yes stop_codon:yes gene_type:complete